MIYLDHNATTPPHPRVVAAMRACLENSWGNPSSLHGAGRAARAAVEEARERLAAFLGVSVPEIIFTSGGTEADNLAIRGVIASGGARGRHVVTTAVEHPAVLETCRALEDEGAAVTYVPPDAEGVVSPEAVAEALRPDTALVSVMAANNEVGSIQPVAEIAALARERGIPFHSDAVQALGRLSGLEPGRSGADLLSFSAHKVNGPKGVGALYARKGLVAAALQRGGPQERGLRGGTENTAGIAGFAEAVAVLQETAEAERERLRGLRDAFEAAVLGRIAGSAVNGAGAPRLPNTSSIVFAGCRADLLVMALDLRGTAASAGSACASGSVKASPVLLAMGRNREEAASSLRFSFGLGNGPDDVEAAVNALAEAVEAVREP